VEGDETDELASPVAGAIFDLDGAPALTVDLHEATWKEVFDTFFALRLRRFGEWPQPFDGATTEAHAVVARDPTASEHCSRHGVSSGQRGRRTTRRVMSPWPGWGSPAEVVSGGVRAGARLTGHRYPSLLNGLRALGVGITLASADEDAERILARIGPDADRFDVALFEALGSTGNLAPTPVPDTLPGCLERMEIGDTGRVVVFDDAIVRVQPPGLVVGNDRGGNASVQRAHGAGWVVQDLHEIAVQDIIAHLSRAKRS